MRYETTATLFLVPLALSCTTELPSQRPEKPDTYNYVMLTQSLGEHVAHGRVDYRGLRSKPEALNNYLNQAAYFGPSDAPDLYPTFAHRLAFHLNTYNASVLANVISREPFPATLEGHKIDFFYLTRVRVDGRATNLYDYEHDVIRPLAVGHYRDTGNGAAAGRIHAALNCASVGCPSLPSEAFAPATLEAQLDQVTRAMVDDPKHVAYDPATHTATVSAVFEWFPEDFLTPEGKESATLVWINRYRSAPVPVDAKVRFVEWDWQLNAQPSN